MPLLPRIAKACLHFWEEPCISGENGSGTVFFSGCSLRCVYCQNYLLSHNGFGKTVSYNRLAEIFSELEAQGAHNINLVNPSHYVGAVEKALDIYRPRIPIVYNSGGYDDISAAEKDYIDIYLFDLKYCNAEKALQYSGAADYFDVATGVISAAYKRIGKPVFDSSGTLKKGVIIRHLLLPSSTNDAIGIINWVKENCPYAIFSLMAQYLPCGKADKYKMLSRRVTAREYNKVSEYLQNCGLEYCYLQEKASSDERYIPDFNLDGV